MSLEMGVFKSLVKTHNCSKQLLIMVKTDAVLGRGNPTAPRRGFRKASGKVHFFFVSPLINWEIVIPFFQRPEWRNLDPQILFVF